MVQGDGNLVVFRGYDFSDPNKKAIWSTGPNGSGGNYFLNVQPDGNLVLLQGTPFDIQGAVWSTGTGRTGDAGYYLMFDEQEKLCLKNRDGITIWSSAN